MNKRLLEVEEFAKELIKTYAPDYSFFWMHKKSTLGICYNGTKRIGLSTHYVLNYSDELIIDTILHEIAHALTPHDKGHGKAWKAMCVKLGCRPERCKQLDRVDHKWEMKCASGCCVWKYYRKPSKRYIGATSKACRTKIVEIVPV